MWSADSAARSWPLVSRAWWGSPRRRRPQVVMGRSADSIYMVMEFVEHDLKGLAESMRQPFTTAEARHAPASRAHLPLGTARSEEARAGHAPAVHSRGSAPRPRPTTHRCRPGLARPERELAASMRQPFMTAGPRRGPAHIRAPRPPGIEGAVPRARAGQVPHAAAAGGRGVPARQLGAAPRPEDQQHPLLQPRRAQGAQLARGRAPLCSDRHVRGDTVLKSAILYV